MLSRTTELTGRRTTHFLKNVQLLGASLFVLVLAGEPWGYALSLGLF
ncbi:hypothetical protein ACFR99_01305 [Haloarchaeobius amylolyticus]|uniref:Uncharacterized protein n=1 Tax=Haloarchaeobius amylolyticus TaxID=1198296 RepID=A0ABD6BAY0_9EURY